MADIEAGDVRGAAPRARLEMSLGFKETEVAEIRRIQFLALERGGVVRGKEIAHLIAGFEVGVELAVSRLHALADDQTLLVLTHFKNAAVGDFEHLIVVEETESAAARPPFGEDPAHALVEIHHYPCAVL